jgi:hypothetical protein
MCKFSDHTHRVDGQNAIVVFNIFFVILVHILNYD